MKRFAVIVVCCLISSPAFAKHRVHPMVQSIGAGLAHMISTINYKLARFVHPTGKCPAGSREALATYYWDGQRVASGGRFNPNGLTCAHRKLPFGTVEHISNPRNGRTVMVTVNDRGPFTRAEFDLSLGAARALGMNTSSYVCVSQ